MKLVGKKKNTGDLAVETNSETKMGVHNADFIMEKMGQDCLPLQYIREITENAIQAVEARKKLCDQDGIVEWMEHPDSLRRWGVVKLCCLDTGTGMTADEMTRYLRDLSRSGRRQSNDANFGVGAKISILASNKAGAEFESWVDGKGVRARMYRDSKGEFHLLNPENIAETEMPKRIRDFGGCGTVVTLLGDNEATSNTYEPPDDLASASKVWVIKEINRRYYDFPKGVSVMAPSTDGHAFTAQGQKWYFDQHSKASNRAVVEGPDGTWRCHYWIIDKNNRENYGWNYDGGGRVAALYQGELYHYEGGSIGTSSVGRKLGIPVGQNRVAAIIEHDGAECKLDRSALQLATGGGSVELPWEEMFDFLKENHPEIIKSMIRKLLKDSSSAEGKIQSLLKKMTSGKLLGGKSKSTHASKEGSKIGGDGTISGESMGGRSSDDDSDREGSGPGKSGGRGGAGRGSEPPINEGDKKKAKRHNRDIFSLAPSERLWVSGKEADMQYSFARYDHSNRRLLLNKDFPVFRELERAAINQARPEFKKAVEAEVRGEYELLLVEVIVNALLQEGKKGYDEKWREQVLSEAALTASALVRNRQSEKIVRAIKKYK